MVVSIFNDVIGPVMRGPSSSHCAAAQRIGCIARDVMECDVVAVDLAFDTQGSLPTTHDTQGSDMGLIGGLLGWETTDVRLPGAVRAAQERGIRFSATAIDERDPHPSTYRLTLTNGHGGQHTLRAISTGGGMMEIIALDGFPVSMAGDYFETLLWTTGDGYAFAATIAEWVHADQIVVHQAGGRHLVEIKAQQFVSPILIEQWSRSGLLSQVRRCAPVLPVLSRRLLAVPFGSCAEMMTYDAGRGMPLPTLALLYEGARSGQSEAELIAKMIAILRILRASIAEGLAGTEYADRLVGPQSLGFQQALHQGRLLNGGVLNRIVLYVSALMEVKSAMGVIVAAPTAGACAALPAAVIAVAEELGLGEETMARALLASGVIGVFIATQWTFAAEVGGCQAEGGSAACMAAAALTVLGGGSLPQALTASSLALQSMLGLICDPVAGRVEMPCLGKNVLAATNALSCANMALAGYDAVIPLDEVISAARAVGDLMPRAHRCTSLGGLSMTPTSVALGARLARASVPAVAATGGCTTGCSRG